MSLRTLVEINHDLLAIITAKKNEAAFGKAIVEGIIFGERGSLPNGVKVKYQRHHSDQCPVSAYEDSKSPLFDSVTEPPREKQRVLAYTGAMLFTESYEKNGDYGTYNNKLKFHQLYPKWMPLPEIND